jgi:hypothetical protein
MFQEVVFVSDFPKEINRNKAQQLHADGKASLSYRDGYSMYHLNGINVPEKLALTPANKLKAKDIIKEENADYRREGLRKIGEKRAIEELGAETVDTFKCPVGGKYELLMLDIGLESKRPYLKMKNPSLKNVYHYEGVAPGTKTCKEALAFRLSQKTYIAPKELT